MVGINTGGFTWIVTNREIHTELKEKPAGVMQVHLMKSVPDITNTLDVRDTNYLFDRQIVHEVGLSET